MKYSKSKEKSKQKFIFNVHVKVYKLILSDEGFETIKI
jgi:hypothetical protein